MSGAGFWMVKRWSKKNIHASLTYTDLLCDIVKFVFYLSLPQYLSKDRRFIGLIPVMKIYGRKKCDVVCVCRRDIHLNKIQ